LGSCRRFGWAVVASTAVLAPSATHALPPDDGGGLVGWVESTHGVPVAGALVSIFGKGIRGGSLVTLADSQGQFVLPSLPAGSYTLRAVGKGHEPSAAQHVTVLPNRDALYTLSLTPVGEKAEGKAAADAEDSQAEWRWLVRHKRRSVLESEGPELPPADQPQRLALATAAPDTLGMLDGSVELAATSGSRDVPQAGGFGPPVGMGSLQLQGRLTEGVQWTLGGLMSENEGRAWRVAAEFVLEPGGGHHLQVGTGYGADERATLLATTLPTEPDRAVGAAFVRDRWQLGEHVTATTGVRYTYLGFLDDQHHADAVVQVDVQSDRDSVVRASVSTHTLAPGGDLLTISTVAASPAITWARLENGLRPARSFHYEVGVERNLSPGARVGAHLFAEETRDALLTVFEGGVPYVSNAGTLDARGFGVTLGHRWGNVVDGSLTYTFGQGTRAGRPLVGYGAPITGFDRAEFHDLSARVETFIDWSDTRLAALCRLNTLSESSVSAIGSGRPNVTSARFDIQLTQGLPFLAPLTRADWEVLVAVRNMFYEASQAGFLDELAVQDPPTRVVGGISVKF
jgi:TonB-dependent receptor-like protein/carboxypeptidase family protein